MAATGLLCLDARCLDDRPPLFDLGFLKSAERLRGLLGAWLRASATLLHQLLRVHCWANYGFANDFPLVHVMAVFFGWH